ncbi:MAG: hypothetical protein KDF58_02845 [Alphaproteobacteria bacterium]|nr:hypothetical protein [Alphaproteobacteria bacterium]HPF45786.1 hypothetical protein [Emcibacteraceae bacterium]HRW28692.1 hypothetical protein [Emcibacteraceae bacterium]
MVGKKIKLNALQTKTLALFQELAKSEETSARIEGSKDISIMFIPRPHGNHVHIGKFVVSAKDASGLANEIVWKVLERKGLAKSEFPYRIILTEAGLSFKTGYHDEFEVSDH